MDELKTVIERRECLVMTSKSMQCLLIKFIEMSSQHMGSNKKEEPFSEELQILQEILLLMRVKGRPIIDEADSVLHIMHEVSFSCGNKVSLPEEEILVVAEIMKQLYTNPDIKNLIHTEGGEGDDKKSQVLTEQVYEDNIKTVLTDSFVNQLGKIPFKNQEIKDKVSSFINGKLKEEGAREKLGHYLCRDKARQEDAQVFYDRLDPEVQNVVALAGEYISHYLSHTLTKICGENYGLAHSVEGVAENSATNLLAIPFDGVFNPKLSSMHANEHITMAYTIQAYMKEGIPRKIIENQIGFLRDKAMREIAASGNTLALNDTEAKKIFDELRGNIDMPIFNYTSEQLDSLVNLINGDYSSKLAYVVDQVLPTLERSQFKISCNTLNLIAFYLRADGFTGTLCNGDSMHPLLNPLPAEGTEAKTLDLLWKNSLDTALTVKEGSTEFMLTQLKEKGVSFDMICDTGGYFKEESNSFIAHQIAQSSGKETVFYNAKGEQCITNGSQELLLSQSKLEPEERQSFLDQNHTTGADVPQKPDAVSLVTIGRHSTLRDVCQSAWRQRDLDKLQRVRFVVSEDVATIMRKKLGLEENAKIQLPEILRFVIENQLSKRSQENDKALREGLENVILQIAFKVFINKSLKPEKKLQVVSQLMERWVRPAIHTPHERYGKLPTEQEAEKTVKGIQARYEDELKTLFEQMPWLELLEGISQEESLSEVQSVVSRLKDALPEKLQTPIKTMDNDQTMEVENETDTDTELAKETEVEVEREHYTEDAPITYFRRKESSLRISDFKDYFNGRRSDENRYKEVVKIHDSNLSTNPKSTLYFVNIYPYFTLSSYLKTTDPIHTINPGTDKESLILQNGEPELETYANAFEGIEISLNVLECFIEKGNRAILKFLGSKRTDFHHLLIEGERVTLLNHEDAIEHRQSDTYYNLSMGFNDSEKELTDEQRMKVLKIKFLNGEGQFSPEEIKLLESWFRNDGVNRLYKLYTGHILRGYPNKVKNYEGSTLQALFKKMRGYAERG